MKIAVTVERPELDAPVDQRLGRARYVVVVDADTMAWEAIDNSHNMDLTQGAGIQAARNMLSRSPQVVLTGNCGPKAFQVFAAGGVKVVTGVKGTARDAVKGFLEGRYAPAQGPNVDGHWVS